MNEENRGFVFCLDDLDEVVQHKEFIEKLGYKLIQIKHFEDVIDAQSDAILHGEIDVPVIFFINSSVFLKAWDNDQVRLRHLKRKYIGVILVFEGEIQLADRMHEVLIDELELPATSGRIKRLLRNAEKRMLLEIEKSKLRREIGHRVLQMKEMQQIGISLSIERSISKLLENILTKARKLTDSDAGSMYLLDRKNPNKLRFVNAQNDSVDVPFEESVMNLDKSSIAGCCVVDGELINIVDAYRISADAPYKHSQEWDDLAGYRTKSILCVPMKKIDGETIGCIQLINRKIHKNVVFEDPIFDVEKHVIRFDNENQSMISSFASQAAVAIDNSYLLEDIENLIEGLVRASVVAIESRDPATSGHSERIAELSVRLAKTVNDDDRGIYKGVFFSEDSLRVLKYASLLHDFGKVGVREEILRKENKLFKHEQDNLTWKIELYKRMKELDIIKQVIEKHVSGEEFLTEEVQTDIEMKIMKSKIECDKLLEKVNEASLPLPMNDSLIHDIKKYQDFKVTLSNGVKLPLVSEIELEKLSINFGSLTGAERKEIESHVVHTVNFLKEIPWTKDLKDISKIAGSHHERNDGAGYPEGLIISEIPLASKIMAIADVFDSLTAWDRPYKDALPVSEALEILREDAAQNKLDSELVRLFFEHKVYEKPEVVEEVVKNEVSSEDFTDDENNDDDLPDFSETPVMDFGKVDDGMIESGIENFDENLVIFPKHPMSDAIEFKGDTDEESDAGFEDSTLADIESSPYINDSENMEIVKDEPDQVDVVVSNDFSVKVESPENSDIIDYSDYEETRTSLPQDFIDVERQRLNLLDKNKNYSESQETEFDEFEKNKLEALIEESSDKLNLTDEDILETNLILETPEFTAQSEISDNTENVDETDTDFELLNDTSVSEEKDTVEKPGLEEVNVSTDASDTEESNAEEDSDVLQIKEENAKPDITDETSIHADLGSKTELGHFVNQVKDEIKSQIPVETEPVNEKKTEQIVENAQIEDDSEENDEDKLKLDTISEVLSDEKSLELGDSKPNYLLESDDAEES